MQEHPRRDNVHRVERCFGISGARSSRNGSFCFSLSFAAMTRLSNGERIESLRVPAPLTHLEWADKAGVGAELKGFGSRRDDLKNPMSERSYTTVPMRVSSTKVSVASSMARLLRPFGGRMKSCFASILSFFSGGIAISYVTGRR